MQIELHKRYPNSRTEDITDAYLRGHKVGYDMGYKAGYDVGYKAGCHAAARAWEQEYKRLQSIMPGILVSGEATERARNDSELG
jgi:hypothetical protein